MAAAQAARDSVEMDRDFWIRFLIVGGALFGTFGLAAAWHKAKHRQVENAWGSSKARRGP